MPKRAPIDEPEIDPVRSRLAAAVSTEAPSRRADKPTSGNGSKTTKKTPRANLPQDRLTVHTKVMITPAEKERNDEIAHGVRTAFGSKVSPSQITRAMWSILAGAEEAIEKNARRGPAMEFPSYGDHRGMAEYEDALAAFLETVLKRS